MSSSQPAALLGRLPNPKSGTVQEVHIPKRKYLMVDGSAELGGRDYQNAVKGLYSHAYAIKFLPKSGVVVPGYEQFSVQPLEGLYQESDPTRNWTLLIPVPDFVTDQTIRLARAELRRKKKDVDDDVRLADWEQGEVIQTLHLGPYDKEQPAVDLLHRYADAHGLTLTGRQNEIYLNDPGRVAPEKIKVIIRYQVQK